MSPFLHALFMFYRHRKRVLLPVAATLALGLSAAPAASAAVFGTQGISSRAGVSPAKVDRAIDLAARSGAKVVRVEANWAALEPRAQGERSPAAVAALDRVIVRAANRGMRTLLFIVYTPCWASSAPADVRDSCTGPAASRPEVSRYRPADPNSVVPISTYLAGRYASMLAAFQIWNEPDQSNEKYWAGPNKVATYVAMTRALYRPLKRAAPQVPVLAGSFVGTNGAWLKAMYAAGIKGHYDGLAVQFYSRTLYGLRATRAVQRANGDSKPLWLTEFGYTSCYRRGGPAIQIDQPCVSRRAQAQGLSDVLAAIRSRRWIAAAVQYTLYDDRPGGYTFGLVDVNGALKPAYAAVRRVLSGRTRSPRRPRIRLRAVRGRVVASGSASLAELLTLRVERRGVLRYRATLVTDRRNRWRIVLPAALGTRGLTVRLSAGWTGRAVGRI
jgi:hypothetical protein